MKGEALKRITIEASRGGNRPEKKRSKGDEKRWWRKHKLNSMPSLRAQQLAT